MLHPVLNHAIEHLLTVWRRYDDVNRSRADHVTRATARARLDVERLRVHRLRRGLHPEARELEEVALSTTCPSLEAAVFIYHSELLPDGGFACPCGSVVEASLSNRIE